MGELGRWWQRCVFLWLCVTEYFSKLCLGEFLQA
jgi:hypothetical protein